MDFTAEMDSLDLLAREDEFKKLNKQLEKKTESLMKEIEHVMQKQDFFSEFSGSLSLNSNHSTANIKKHCCERPVSPQPVNNKPNFKKRTQKNSKNSNLEIEDSNLENVAKDTCNNCAGNANYIKDCAKRVACVCCTDVRRKKNEDLEFLYAFVSVNVKDKVLPQSFSKDNISVESVCKFLASKVKLMQEQIDKLQTTINKKASQCEAHLTQLAELEGERMTLLNKTNNMKTSTVEMRAKCMALQNRLDEKDRLYKEQRSETDKLTSEVKKLRCRNTGVEARQASQEQAIEELKQQLQVATRCEKELRDSSRSLSASHQSAISLLETQLKALTSRIDKQNALIDNLRKQNALLHTDGALKALEREYCKFLTED